MRFIGIYMVNNINTHLTFLKGGIDSSNDRYLIQGDYPLEGIIGVSLRRNL